ncbi:hypothetical protein GGR52DRAFT_583427 [Hypoxylon sp. FL1284]|nr:hypothetical protein GGR52DRAFT_583427 [Hypoxylon sp. FL1284]
MTAVTKSTRGANGILTTLTYELPSQTTAFAPSRAPGDRGTGMPARCAISAFCRGLSYAAYSSRTAAGDPHPLAGQTCMGVQATTTTSAGSTPRAGVGFDEACWPTNYFALFDDEWGLLDGVAGTATTADAAAAAFTDSDGGGDEDGGDDGGDSASTAAFPGDACLAGWTTACTTTVTAGASPLLALYPQAWCCPPGGWACATATADGAAQQRLCRSLVLFSSSASSSSSTGREKEETMTTSTDIWMSWDPPLYTWRAPVTAALETDPAQAATVFRKVFPLALSSGGGEETFVVAETATAVPRVEARSSSLPLDGDESAHVSSWCMAVGFLGAVALGISLLGFALWRRAKGGRAKRCREEAVSAAVEDGDARKTYEVEVLLKPDEVKLA